MSIPLQAIKKISTPLSIAKQKVAIIGCGNWASALSTIIGENAKRYLCFDNEVRMWVREEMIGDKKLTEIMNQEHENVKYPYMRYKERLPENVIAVPRIEDAVKDANCLVFCIPHQFLHGALNQMRYRVNPDAYAISCIKGVDHDEDGRLRLITGVINQELNVDCSVLCGANIANQVAAGDYAEATLGYRNRDNAEKLQVLFNSRNFNVSLVNDPVGVEFCGSLKNIIALGVGFVKALDLSSNTTAAVIRIGLMEMKKFAKMFYHGVQDDTFFQSSGVADLITTCSAGRNVRCAEIFIRSKKSWEEVEREQLKGQKLQGTGTCMEVYDMLEKMQMLHEFPLMTMIYNVAYRGYDPMFIVEGCRMFNGPIVSPYAILKEE